MHKSLQEFIALVKNDGLIKPSHYNFRLVKYPSYFTDNRKLVSEFNKLHVLCEATQLPGVQLQTMNHEEFGETREVPYQRAFDNVSLTFILDRKMIVKNFFDQWLEYVVDPVTRTHGFYDKYIGNIIIEMQDASTDSKTMYSVRLEDCYPKSISPIDLSYESKGFAKLTVSMNYRNYVRLDVTENE